MIVDCISDLHGHYPELKGGDLLIAAGDLTARDLPSEYDEFLFWLENQKYTKKIFIGGNHDNNLSTGRFMTHTNPNKTWEYLCDSGTEFQGVKIWGSPWTRRFAGMNPKCMAFTLETEEELAEKWALIPNGIDILVTHSPSEGVLDEIGDYKSQEILSLGSETLIKPMIQSGCRLHVFGHIHEGYGKFYNAINKITYVNASHVNECYEAINKPIRIIL